MATHAAAPLVEAITDPRAAKELLHPLRARIVGLAAEPTSASELGDRLDEPRQKVNYHVHQLVDAGLLEPAGTRPARGVDEKLYRATAQAYVLAPDVAGEASARLDEAKDALSASTVLALAGRTQSELAHVMREASANDQRVATLSIDATVHFAGPAERKAFTEALHEAVVDLVERFDTPQADGARPYRVTVTSHPRPREEDDEDER